MNEYKLPWKLEHEELYEGDELAYVIVDREGERIMHNQTYYNQAPEEEIAKYILEVCNNFYKALELLRMSKEDISELTTLADGYENDYIELSKFLDKFEEW